MEGGKETQRPGFRSGISRSEVFISDEAVALGVRLEDALNQRASRVILLVCALVELVRGTTSTGGALLLLHVTKDVLLCHVLLSGGL